MSTLRQRLAAVGARLRRFVRAREAAAAVEFALVVPIMITLYMGTIEVSDLIAVDRRISVISGTVGDLVARVDGTIVNSELTDYFKASEGIIMPYSKTPLKQVVTCVQVSSTGVTSVTWSKAYNGGTVKTVGSTYALPPAMVDISKGSWVIVAESTYAYKPLLAMVVSSAINLRRISYYLPRYGQQIFWSAT